MISLTIIFLLLFQCATPLFMFLYDLSLKFMFVVNHVANHLQIRRMHEQLLQMKQVLEQQQRQSAVASPANFLSDEEDDFDDDERRF